MRDMLIKLLRQINFDYCDECCYAFEDGYKSAPDFAEFFADRLIAEGVIVTPCKVGDKVYRIWNVGKYGKSIAEFVVTNVSQIMENTWVIRYQKQAKSLCSTPTRYQCNFNDIGKTVFLSREETEKALTKRRTNND